MRIFQATACVLVAGALALSCSARSGRTDDNGSGGVPGGAGTFAGNGGMIAGNGGSISSTAGTDTGGSSAAGPGAGGSSAAGGSGGDTSAMGGAPAGATGGTAGTTSGGASGTAGSTPVVAVKSAGCGKMATITSGSAKQITVGGMTRTYNIKIPDGYDSNKPYRLILGYHGATQSANTVTGESYFGLLPGSDGNTIFVAPQGLGDAWPNTGGADVAFSRQLVMQLEAALCIDTTRIFAEGFSMGGAMAYSMACSASDIVRAVAVHSGCPTTACAQQHNTPVAYFMTHGTADQICAYPRYGVPLLQDFAKVNGCTMPDPSQQATAFAAALPKPTSVNSACIEFTGCKPGYPTRSCLFVGPHEWNPGRPTWVPAEVWSFFKQF